MLYRKRTTAVDAFIRSMSKYQMIYSPTRRPLHDGMKCIASQRHSAHRSRRSSSSSAIRVLVSSFGMYSNIDTDFSDASSFRHLVDVCNGIRHCLTQDLRGKCLRMWVRELLVELAHRSTNILHSSRYLG